MTVDIEALSSHHDHPHLKDPVEVDDYPLPLNIEMFREAGRQVIAIATIRDSDGALQKREAFGLDEAKWVEDKNGGHWFVNHKAA